MKNLFWYLGAIVLFWLILTILVLFKDSIAQEINYNKDGSVDLHFKTTANWETYKQKVIFLNNDFKSCDSNVTYSLLPALRTSRKIIDTLDYQVRTLKQIVHNDSLEMISLLGMYVDQNTQRKPFIEWLGFYTGVESGYFFADSIISKETIINSVWNNISITGTGYFKIKDFLLSAGVSIPLKGKFGLTAGIRYRIF